MNNAVEKSGDRRFSTAIALFRIVAVTAVVALHFAMNSAKWCSDAAGLAFFNSVLKGMCFWAVPVFVIMSGYCLLGRDFNIGEFYLKRCRRVLVPTLVWSAFYFLLRSFTRSGLSLGVAVSDILTGYPYYHLWFMYMLIGLYLAAPLCRWFLRSQGRYIWWWLAVFWLVVGCAGPALWEMPVMKLLGLKSIPYLGLFVAGGALKELGTRRPLWVAGSLLGAVYLLVAGPVMSWLSREYGVDGVPYFYYTGLFTSAGSLAVFAGGMHWLEFSRCPEVWKKRLNLVSGLAFGVYLVHPVMLLAAEKLMTRFAAGGLVYAGLLAAVVAASWGFALAASRIPFLGRWLV